MRALQAAGRQADALAAYEDTRRVLADQLGIDPSPGPGRGAPGHPARRAAAAAGRAGPRPGPAGPGAAQPRAGTPSRAGLSGPGQPSFVVPDRSNLPAQLTSFVGREEELGRLAKLLGESRLVTLTGPGGAGKTRLSVEASARLAGELADGIWFVPLAPVRDALDVPQAVLTAIGVQDAGWLDPVEAARLAALAPLDRLADVLARRRAAAGAGQLRAPGGRGGPAGGPGAGRRAGRADPGHQPGAAGHHRRDAVPGAVAGAAAGGRRRGGGGAVRGGARCSPTGRPRSGRGSRWTTPRPARSVRICRALDGIPLAIELAAARLRALTPAQVADRLDDRFRLLSVGSRGALPRHQTLRAIVDWSWELLDEPERAVAAPAVGVPRRRDAGQRARRSARWAGIAGPVVDVVAALVDKSLVTATGEHEVRYRLLETVRAYAADRLAEAGEADAARRGPRGVLPGPGRAGRAGAARPRPGAVAEPAERGARQLRGRPAVRHRRRRRARWRCGCSGR